MQGTKSKRKKKNDIGQYYESLPKQKIETIQLYDTTEEDVANIIRASDFRQNLVKLKSKFYHEIKFLSEKYGVDSDVRVYFTFKDKLINEPNLK